MSITTKLGHVELVQLAEILGQRYIRQKTNIVFRHAFDQILLDDEPIANEILTIRKQSHRSKRFLLFLEMTKEKTNKE